MRKLLLFLMVGLFLISFASAVPTVTLESPADGSTAYSRLQIFDCSATSLNYIFNITFYHNASGTFSPNQTTTYVAKPTSNETFSQSLDATWSASETTKAGMKILTNDTITIRNMYKTSTTTATKCYITNSAKTILKNGTFSGNTCYMGDYSLSASTTYYFLVDNTGGGASYTVHYYYPKTFPIISKYWNWTAGVDNAGVDSTSHVVVWDKIEVGGASLSVTITPNITLTNPSTLWNCRACDNTGACAFGSSNYTILLDSSAPQLALNYPTPIINYGRINGTLQLNFTATDTNLDKCWYNYNGTNSTATTCTSGVPNLANITLSTKKNVTIYANDTAGNLNSSFFSWNYYLFASNISYKTATTTTSSENFIIAGVKDISISSISAKLNYAGVNYTSIVSIVGNNFTISNNLEIPAGVTSRNLFWYITATGTGGTINIQTETFVQNVSTLSITYCTSPAAGLTLNFTTYNAATLLKLNSTFEASFNYYAYGGTGGVLETYSYKDLLQNKSNWMFCLNSSGLNVTLNGFFSYSATGYDRREYIIQNGIIGNFTQNIPLFLGATADTDIVTIHVKDQNYNNLVGALVAIQEWNIGTNTYSTIGMLTTSSEGTGIINLELYNVWYRAVVSYEGNIVTVTDVQKLSGTDWFITVELTTTNPYDLFGTISHGLVFDENTNITTFTWLDNSGYTQKGCLEVRKMNSLGYTTVYYDCITSVSGTINYQLTETGEYNILGTIHLIPVYDVSSIIDSLSVRIGIPELTERVSRFGKVLSFIFIGTSAFIGISAGSPYLGVVGLVLAVLGSWKMGWLNITEGILWGIISIVLIILSRISRKGT